MPISNTDPLRDVRLLTDGGLETYMTFHEGRELPEFAAFVLLDDEQGRAALRAYFEPFLETAARYGMGFVLESPTWRANPDWGARIGLGPLELDDINRRGIAFVSGLREEYLDRLPQILVSGTIGPRGDGYVPTERMSVAESAAYHHRQIAVCAAAGADLVTSFTMPYADEGHGIARGAAAAGIPCVIGFTVETDGRLPSGEHLAEVITRIDTDCPVAPLHYMINCAHPSHFERLFDGAAWNARVRALRPNASACSHAELERMTELDAGDPADLAERTLGLVRRVPQLRVLGGCCGTDHRHVSAIARAVSRARVA
jgi:homocysteine S-methyltransferase